MAGILAFDTSNYTTSAAILNTKTGRGANVSRLLPVEAGKLGLRQSEAVFAHVRVLPEIIGELTAKEEYQTPGIFAASATPRSQAGSYMPCFLVGAGAAREMSYAGRAPLHTFSHQQGHIAAAAYSAGRMELLEKPFLAWHLSGGTTELLLVRPDEHEIITEQILGGSTDISAGQLVDRAGVLLGLGFPAGVALAQLAETADEAGYHRVQCRDMRFSLSGMENKVQQMHGRGESSRQIAGFVIQTIIHTIVQATAQALECYPGLPVLCSGGVAANTQLRQQMQGRFDACFAQPEFARDNAMGIAVLAAIREEGGIPPWTLR